LVLTFKESTNLAGAYGMTVSKAMVITTVLVYVVARDNWGWSIWAAGSVTAALLVMDLAFLGTNLLKFFRGGWIPLSVSLLVWLLMHCWRYGQSTVGKWIEEATTPVEDVEERIKQEEVARVPGTGVFLTPNPVGVPMILLRHIEHNQVLHERVVLLTVKMEDVPRVPRNRREEVEELGEGLWRMILHYGFMEDPNVPAALKRKRKKLDLDLEKVTYYVGHLTLVRGEKKRRRSWRMMVYAVLARNAAESTTFYGLPADRVFETGVRVQL
jgi:KUP system potassium uptake protein